MSNFKCQISIAFILYSSFLFSQTAYISRVWEYRPAPGQFVNKLPAYEQGDDEEDMRMNAEEAIADNHQGMISLGGWGGYVVFGFDHMVPNRAGKDLLVMGNAFEGSSEPGIVLVSHDSNGNGRPDDTWYELAGSEYNTPLTVHDYTVTYTRQEAGKEYPQWIEEDEMTFTGSRLPDNYEDLSGQGTYYFLSAYDYGYVDNYPNTDPKGQLDIDWAVDDNGQPVSLPGIHFVKVYNAMHQRCGWLGETSTEITGAQDLSMPEDLDQVNLNFEILHHKSLRDGQLLILRDGKTYNAQGLILCE